jgi:hypothetical protein
LTSLAFVKHLRAQPTIAAPTPQVIPVTKMNAEITIQFPGELESFVQQPALPSRRLERN